MAARPRGATPLPLAFAGLSLLAFTLPNCHRHAAPDATAHAPITMRANFPAARDASALNATAPVVTPWCVRVLPLADARAIDTHGHVIALRNGTITDETSGSAPERLPPMSPACTAFRDHLAFTHDGSAVAIAHGRVYFRAHGSTVWTGSPACTDLAGEPWSPRSDGSGWALVGRRFPGTDPALLMTEDTGARVGWYAITALDPTMTGLSLEGGGSFVALTSGGHVVFVDRERHVAGEVLAANDALFTSITRTDAGLAIWRDESPTMRDIVLGTSVVARFDRQHRVRPAGPRTLHVFAAEFGRAVAVTDRGVEWGAEGSSPFVEVAAWPPGTAAGANTAVLGWVSEAIPAVVTSTALAARRCPDAPPAR